LLKSAKTLSSIPWTKPSPLHHCAKYKIDQMMIMPSPYVITLPTLLSTHFNHASSFPGLPSHSPEHPGTRHRRRRACHWPECTRPVTSSERQNATCARPERARARTPHVTLVLPLLSPRASSSATTPASTQTHAPAPKRTVDDAIIDDFRRRTASFCQAPARVTAWFSPPSNLS
jgi:hypothetical protein